MNQFYFIVSPEGLNPYLLVNLSLIIGIYESDLKGLLEKCIMFLGCQYLWNYGYRSFFHDSAALDDQQSLLISVWIPLF